MGVCVLRNRVLDLASSRGRCVCSEVVEREREQGSGADLVRGVNWTSHGVEGKCRECCIALGVALRDNHGVWHNAGRIK